MIILLPKLKNIMQAGICMMVLVVWSIISVSCIRHMPPKAPSSVPFASESLSGFVMVYWETSYPSSEKKLDVLDNEIVCKLVSNLKDEYSSLLKEHETLINYSIIDIRHKVVDRLLSVRLIDESGAIHRYDYDGVSWVEWGGTISKEWLQEMVAVFKFQPRMEYGHYGRNPTSFWDLPVYPSQLRYCGNRIDYCGDLWSDKCKGYQECENVMLAISQSCQTPEVLAYLDLLTPESSQSEWRIAE